MVWSRLTRCIYTRIRACAVDDVKIHWSAEGDLLPYQTMSLEVRRPATHITDNNFRQKISGKTFSLDCSRL